MRFMDSKVQTLVRKDRLWAAIRLDNVLPEKYGGGDISLVLGRYCHRKIGKAVDKHKHIFIV